MGPGRRVVLRVVSSGLAVAAFGCGGDDDDNATEGTSSTSTTASTPTTRPSTTTTAPTLTTLQDLDTLVVSEACEDRWDTAQRTLAALSDGDPEAFDRVVRTFYEQLAETCPTRRSGSRQRSRMVRCSASATRPIRTTT